MEATDALKLVADMRHAQREYFRTRSNSWLHQSKLLEKRVDIALRDVLEQPTLFKMDSANPFQKRSNM